MRQRDNRDAQRRAQLKMISKRPTNKLLLYITNGTGIVALILMMIPAIWFNHLNHNTQLIFVIASASAFGLSIALYAITKWRIFRQYFNQEGK